MSTSDLTAALSSRICHDLISPIGAIVNGIDLIREIGEGEHADELAMIGQSATRASALLQFYRIAFGIADSGAADIARQTMSDHAAALIASPRVSVQWHDPDGPPMPRAQARLVGLLLLCAKLIVGLRGQILVAVEPGGDVGLRILPSDGGELNTDVLSCFDPKAIADVTPRLVEFPLAYGAAEDLGLQLVHEFSDNGLVVRCRPATEARLNRA